MAVLWHCHSQPYCARRDRSIHYNIERRTPNISLRCTRPLSRQHRSGSSSQQTNTRKPTINNSNHTSTSTRNNSSSNSSSSRIVYVMSIVHRVNYSDIGNENTARISCWYGQLYTLLNTFGLMFFFEIASLSVSLLGVQHCPFIHYCPHVTYALLMNVQQPQYE